MEWAKISIISRLYGLGIVFTCYSLEFTRFKSLSVFSISIADVGSDILEISNPTLRTIL